MSQSLNLISINYNASDESEDNASETEVFMYKTNGQKCNYPEVFVEDSDDDQPIVSEPPKKKRKSYSIEFKLKVIHDFKFSKNKAQTAKNFGIDRQLVQEYVKHEEKYRNQLKDRSVKIRERKRLPYPRKPLFPEVERRVMEWFREQRAAGLVVTADGIKSKALEIFPQTSSARRVKFAASNGWCTNFLERNNLKSRTATSVGQKIPPNARDISLLFFERIENFRKKQIDKNFIIANMDEMPIYFDSPMNKTYDYVGNKTIKVKTTGSEKLRLTLMLCAYNDGRKCLPAIIFKGLKKPPKGQFPKDIIIEVSDKGSVTNDLMERWRKTVWSKRPGGLFLNKHLKPPTGPEYRTLLVIDAATPHRNQEFKRIMAKNFGTKVEIIPSGMTPLIQPADESWNKTVKSSIKRQWAKWMALPKQQHELTKSGAVKRPAYDLVAKWCLNAWNELSEEQIINSFKQCNLGDKKDDSSDTKLNSKLLAVLNFRAVPDGNDDPTGLTDDESDVEESQEVIEEVLPTVR